jgi:hypothetical protein
MAQTETKPAIEWAPPVINNVPRALGDLACLIDRLRALLDSNIEGMREAFIDVPVEGPGLSKQAYTLWMIFVLAGEKLAEIDTITAAVCEVAQTETLSSRCSSVARHTQLMRSQAWRQAVNALNAANTSADMSDAAIDLAGRCFLQMMRTRVATLDDFREKLGLIDANAGFTGPHLDELFRDLDILGARARRAVAA